jgi:hypothetical protein
VVAEPKPGGLAEAQATNPLERVEHQPVEGNPLVGDQGR